MNEGSIPSLVLQLMPSLQTNCFVLRLLNCKSPFKISLSVDNEGYISHLCTFYCPRQNSGHNNKIDCPSKSLFYFGPPCSAKHKNRWLTGGQVGCCKFLCFRPTPVQLSISKRWTPLDTSYARHETREPSRTSFFRQ